MRPFARASLLVVFACGGHTPVPPYAAQPASALVQVRYPPPPARVEFVPPRPGRGTVWVDGEWAWRGRLWSWRPGRWVVAPKAARFALWTMVRGEDGTLYFASGVWRDAKGQALPEPTPLGTAKPTPGAVVNPEGERESTGGTLRGARVDNPPLDSAPTGAPPTAVPDAGPASHGAEAPDGAP